MCVNFVVMTRIDSILAQSHGFQCQHWQPFHRSSARLSKSSISSCIRLYGLLHDLVVLVSCSCPDISYIVITVPSHGAFPSTVVD